MKNKKLVIIGAGELARIAFEYFTYDSSYDVFAFSVNKEFIESSEINGIPVVEFEELERIYPPS
ncbi:sugar O-acyltransferase, partial [Vibrio cholerae]